jgi:hypothetical protein
MVEKKKKKYCYLWHFEKIKMYYLLIWYTITPSTPLTPISIFFIRTTPNSTVWMTSSTKSRPLKI